MSGKRIEAVITDVLKGDSQENALDFITYLKANGISLDESDNYWEIKYKGESLCFVWVDGADSMPGPWTIWSDQESGTWASWPAGAANDGSTDCPVDEHTRQIAWANVNVCGNCGGCDSPGKQKTVLGKSFDNLCASTMAFTNPDADALACAKKMIDIRMGDIRQKSA